MSKLTVTGLGLAVAACLSLALAATAGAQSQSVCANESAGGTFSPSKIVKGREQNANEGFHPTKGSWPGASGGCSPNTRSIENGKGDERPLGGLPNKRSE